MSVEVEQPDPLLTVEELTAKVEKLQRELRRTLFLLRDKTPNGAMCQNPLLCHDLGSCPRDPACNH